MSDKTKQILEKISKDFNQDNAVSLRVNGKSEIIKSSDNITIKTKKDKPGIDIYIKENTKNEKVYIPVVLFDDNIEEKVYNDFYIGAHSDVEIIAGCGIHNKNNHTTKHDGVHSFYIEENARVSYIENHYGDGEGNKSLDPVTVIDMKENSYMYIETIQKGDVNYSKRETSAVLNDNSTLEIKEIIETKNKNKAYTNFEIDLNGFNSKVFVSSRSVAKDKSYQEFKSVINGNNKCYGHSECDAIIMDKSIVKAVPDVTAYSKEAVLIHEAAIGKIAKNQIEKLMTLGLSSEEAEKEIINGFLR